MDVSGNTHIKYTFPCQQDSCVKVNTPWTNIVCTSNVIQLNVLNIIGNVRYVTEMAGQMPLKAI